MKLKAVIQREGPSGMREALESSGFYRAVVTTVLVPHLHMRHDIGPAEFYIQECDFAVGLSDLLCEVRLTGVSVNKNRCTNDFYRARTQLEDLYTTTIHPFIGEGRRLQLMVSLMLDQPPYGEHTSLIERSGGSAVWICGGTSLPALGKANVDR